MLEHLLGLYLDISTPEKTPVNKHECLDVWHPINDSQLSCIPLGHLIKGHERKCVPEEADIDTNIARAQKKSKTSPYLDMGASLALL